MVQWIDRISAAQLVVLHKLMNSDDVREREFAWFVYELLTREVPKTEDMDHA